MESLSLQRKTLMLTRTTDLAELEELAVGENCLHHYHRIRFWGRKAQGEIAAVLYLLTVSDESSPGAACTPVHKGPGVSSHHCMLSS